MRKVVVLESVAAMRQWRRSTQQRRVGLVPTMGALHEGHRQLLEIARRDCDVLASSIFVNPTQFAPNEDLAKYPRTFEKDLEIMEEAGVDALFFPSVDELYPGGGSRIFRVAAPDNFRNLAEAKARPGHFDGVATVCTKLFHIIEPQVAFFGQKDALQCVALRNMVQDLNFDIQLRICPTARAEDGLALSSRNAYLDPEARRAAPVIYRALRLARDFWALNIHVRPEKLVAIVRQVLDSEPRIDSIDYISIADYDTMQEFEDETLPDYNAEQKHPVAILSVALRLGGVRLIDNLPLSSS